MRPSTLNIADSSFRPGAASRWRRLAVHEQSSALGYWFQHFSSFLFPRRNAGESPPAFCQDERQAHHASHRHHISRVIFLCVLNLGHRISLTGTPSYHTFAMRKGVDGKQVITVVTNNGAATDDFKLHIKGHGFASGTAVSD